MVAVIPLSGFSAELDLSFMIVGPSADAFLLLLTTFLCLMLSFSSGLPALRAISQVGTILRIGAFGLNEYWHKVIRPHVNDFVARMVSIGLRPDKPREVIDQQQNVTCSSNRTLWCNRAYPIHSSRRQRSKC